MNYIASTLSRIKLSTLAIAILASLCNCGSHKNLSKITLIIDDSFTKEEQWCYITGYKSWVSGYEKWIFDSVKIDKGQKKAKMKIKHPFEESFNITFSKCGPTSKGFTLERNSRVSLQVIPVINNDDGTIRLSGKGSDAYNEDQNFRDSIINPLIEKIENCSTDDSIDYYSNLLALSSIRHIKSTTHPDNAYGNFLALQMGYSSYAQKHINLSELKEFIQKKFPDIPYIQFIGKGDGSPSKESEMHSRRIEQIFQKRAEVFKQDTAIGNKIELSFYDAKNNLISLNQIKEEYILIDIWASWCKPCQKEIPYLKEAWKKYKDKLCIYAVSIDRRFNAWQNAIRRDSTECFTHVLGSDRQGLPNKKIQGLGVKSIPANFLLNNKRQIIAKDLRGKKLIETLDSLIQK